MANHFTRNTRNIKDASKHRLDNMHQNDMASDDQDIYIHNHMELFPITKSLLSITSDDSITVKQTGKNIRNVRVNEDWLRDKVVEYAPEVGDAPVTSVNGKTGDVVIDIPEFEKLTESEVREMVDSDTWLHDKVVEYTPQTQDTSEYQKQILRDDAKQKFITNGKVFMYKETIPMSEIYAAYNDRMKYTLELNEISNISLQGIKSSYHKATVYSTDGGIYGIDFFISESPINNNRFRLIVENKILANLNIDENESVEIDYTGILDFV